ncbi:hypothetical protein J6590_024002 [Homalodisca vitripennis]|nr:hypothetical protein J6590_024002 [Homalodisca vitripennis]
MKSLETTPTNADTNSDQFRNVIRLLQEWAELQTMQEVLQSSQYQFRHPGLAVLWTGPYSALVGPGNDIRPGPGKVDRKTGLSTGLEMALVGSFSETAQSQAKFDSKTIYRWLTFLCAEERLKSLNTENTHCKQMWEFRRLMLVSLLARRGADVAVDDDRPNTENTRRKQKVGILAFHVEAWLVAYQSKISVLCSPDSLILLEIVKRNAPRMQQQLVQPLCPSRAGQLQRHASVQGPRPDNPVVTERRINNGRKSTGIHDSPFLEFLGEDTSSIIEKC